VERPTPPSFTALAIPDLPEFRRGDDVGRILANAFRFDERDVAVIAQKIVSKAEGRVVSLSSVVPSDEAARLASLSDKDPRLCELILRESAEVLRVRPGTIIVRDRRGWVCANAGIDHSNVPSPEAGSHDNVCLLPVDPDASARRIGEAIKAISGRDVGVLVIDSHGRAWREGTVGVTIGAHGVVTLSDRRGEVDRYGYTLKATLVGLADELSAAASILMGQSSESTPAIVIRGLNVFGQGSGLDLQRERSRDLFT
jgi:coenzyme F420-0:L-glutamate ligase/coenzyme F420-1:gamma-L-glutamate ligase